MVKKLAILLSLVCVAAMLPPLPPKRSVKHKPVTTTQQGAGALALVTKSVILPSKTNIIIAWNYSYDDENTTNNIRFRVWGCKTNRVVKPSTNWTMLGITSNRQWTSIIDKTAKCYWLSVTATNTVSHLESDFATQ